MMRRRPCTSRLAPIERAVKRHFQFKSVLALPVKPQVDVIEFDECFSG